jgi:predicted secreted protein
MIKIASILLICLSFLLPGSARALNDQGLSSVLDIIDKAIEQFGTKPEESKEPVSDEEKAGADKAASGTVVNLSKTLGKLSYSRLQCGQADVLAEFTGRVQKMPQEYRNAMRDGFQEGFDQSKAETPLLSEDECERLTESRTRGDKPAEANVKEDNKSPKVEEKKAVKVKPVEDPSQKHMRIAELSGQLAFKRKFCGDDKVVTRDFNDVIRKMPKEYQAEAKKAYWKGYQRGKKLNKDFKKHQCL